MPINIRQHNGQLKGGNITGLENNKTKYLCQHKANQMRQQNMANKLRQQNTHAKTRQHYRLAKMRQ